MKNGAEYESEKTARAKGMSLDISFKQSVEVCRVIKNKKYSAAETILQNVQKMVAPVPYRRFNRGGTGHRKGHMGPGRFPIKTSKNILAVLKSAYSNADEKGLDTESLKICSAVAQKGPKTMKYGRIQGRQRKRTHIEITLSSEGLSKKKKDASFAGMKVSDVSKGSDKRESESTESGVKPDLEKSVESEGSAGGQPVVKEDRPAEKKNSEAESSESGVKPDLEKSAEDEGSVSERPSANEEQQKSEEKSGEAEK